MEEAGLQVSRKTVLVVLFVPSVERDGVTTIFTEELLSPDVADTIARETGTTAEVLSPIESLTPDELSSGADYDSVMRQNLTELRRALGCS